MRVRTRRSEYDARTYMFKEKTRRVQEEEKEEEVDQEKRKENGNEHDITIINEPCRLLFIKRDKERNDKKIPETSECENSDAHVIRKKRRIFMRTVIVSDFQLLYQRKKKKTRNKRRFLFVLSSIFFSIQYFDT